MGKIVFNTNFYQLDLKCGGNILRGYNMSEMIKNYMKLCINLFNLHNNMIQS